MNLSQVIHQRWAAATALNALLPATRVSTGLSVDPTTPYAVVSKEGQSPESMHHDGSGIDAGGPEVDFLMSGANGFHGDEMMSRRGRNIYQLVSIGIVKQKMLPC